MSRMPTSVRAGAGHKAKVLSHYYNNKFCNKCQAGVRVTKEWEKNVVKSYPSISLHLCNYGVNPKTT